MDTDYIVVHGAREHNLKNVSVSLPRGKLNVISGLSGSGKSSLAFDTIFAEGQRRYVESLSSYARMFLGRLEKPEVEYIEGLSPAISIEQKTTHHNPRSTVGTVTEIYDYFRLLWARIGDLHCPSCDKLVKEESIDEMVDCILQEPEGTRLMIFAPVVRGKKGEHAKVLSDALRAGFLRAEIDGKTYRLDDIESLPAINKKQKHDISILVDRLLVSPSERRRITESLETALRASDGLARVVYLSTEQPSTREQLFSERSMCIDCGIAIPELQPRLFSFNNPYGACEACSGLGVVLAFDPDLMISSWDLSLNEGAIEPINTKAAWRGAQLEALSKHYKFSLDTPLKDLPPKIIDILLYGSDDVLDIYYENTKGTSQGRYQRNYEGIIAEMQQRMRERQPRTIRQWLERYMSSKPCASCRGKRLRPEALAVRVAGMRIFEVSEMTILEAEQFFRALRLDPTQEQISAQILKEIRTRLSFLLSVGLNYLHLEREASTLSGGEAQRIRLATQIGSALTGVLYVLDEPTIGLHQRDNERLLATLMHLRDLGNTLIVVEHDEGILRAADYLVDMGPGAGIHGGSIVAAGRPEELMQKPESLTGQYLSGALSLAIPEKRREAKEAQYIGLRGATLHNLKGIDVDIPLGVLTVVSGVSGSGKSSLINGILLPVMSKMLAKKRWDTKLVSSISGAEHIDKIISIDQSAIGRTPRSNPATYVGLFTPIRELFASLPEAKSRGYKPGRFSFNVKGGRCEKCEGAGTLKIEMHFLPDVYVECDLCRGKRYNRETLEVRYKNASMADVLNMSVTEAREFFDAIPRISRKLDTLLSVGLGYITLGQSALTFSGGEAQRIKLSLELSKQGTGNTLYVLDEPTTGLHFVDIQKLMFVLQSLVELGNSVVLIEHNMDVIASADYVIDLGPEGGSGGGQLVAYGTPEAVAAVEASHTGRYLKEMGIKPAKALQ